MNPSERLNKNRVVVAMSGGVDSSVALTRVQEDGFEAIGVTMKLWEYRDVGGNLPHESNCCSIDAINNAKLVCQKVGVPHYTIDFQYVFREKVVDYLIREYHAGRTPNPCIQCNIHLRWGALLKQADLLNAYWIATGHYARIDRKDPKKPVLRKGVDPKKDQSYVLWGITPGVLRRTLLPLGALTKQEVRRLAAKADLVTAGTPESQELCFIPDNDYRQFLKRYSPARAYHELPGEFISENGQPLSQHRGISQYTVGQRRGLGISGPEALYVRKIDPDTNRITLTSRNRMYFDGCTVENPNWLRDPDDLPGGKTVHVHIRYNHGGVPCRISRNDNGSVTADFESPQFAVAPGQSAVFYSGDELLGGGVIADGIIHD